MKYIFMFMLIFLISCGGEEDKDFDCSICKENETCNEAEKKCELKTEFDCSICKENETCNESEKKCELKTEFDCNTCEDYEDCNTELEKCILKEGNCIKDEQCDTTTQVCDLTTHTCKDKEPVVCIENTTKCEENKLLTCTNNSWSEFNCVSENKICETVGNTSSCVEEVVEGGTIYPIRHGDVAEETEVSVKGIVTGIKVDNNDKLGGFYIQEDGANYRGIYIYVKNPYTNNLLLGDEVSVSGVYKEYNDLSEILIEADTQVVKTDINSPRENFSLLNVNNLATMQVEEYESMIVKVKGDFTVGERDSNYNLQISDNNGNTFLIKDEFYTLELNKNDKLSEIRGVLSYNYNKFKIFPRGDYDLIDNTQICSTISCNAGEVCEVTNDIPSCVCDIQNGYYDNNSGACINPCDADGVCIEDNKHTCISSSATDFTCECDSGYQQGDGDVCEVIPYCDSATYGNAFGLTGSELKAELKVIVERGYHNYGYDAGRLAMFSHIDNDNGVIMCIYTGEYANHPYTEVPSEQTKPDNDFFNWEHTWPHSLLGSNASSDLHHLFPTRSYVNSRRSNYPFGNVVGGDRFCDDGNSGPGTCSDSEYDYVSKLKNEIFEPADQQKGNTARAMLYIWIKYDNPSGFMDRADQFNTFKSWNTLDPVDEREHLRNDLVEYYQGNRNPFVDCPQFVDALYQ